MVLRIFGLKLMNVENGVTMPNAKWVQMPIAILKQRGLHVYYDANRKFKKWDNWVH